jgi:catechol 2,3-dioxygenase-like lactoylglutathione lyase family enzyme
VTSIQAKLLNHVNIVPDDYDQAVEHLMDFYGGRFLMDVPVGGEHRACLIEIGRMIIEIFTPSFGSLLKRSPGPCVLGVEYQADIAQVRETIAEMAMPIAMDHGEVLHVHADDCLGMSVEFYALAFVGEDRIQAVPPLESQAYWRDEHPLGLTGLMGYTLAVRNEAAATEFLKRFLGAERVYEEARPVQGGRAIGLKIADAIVELLVPSGTGIIESHLDQAGEGIFSIVFSARDMERVRSYHAERSVELIDGLAPGRLGVPPSVNHGIFIEFTE